MEFDNGTTCLRPLNAPNLTELPKIWSNLQYLGLA